MLSSFDVVLLCFLAVSVMNLAHWNGRRQEHLIYWPDGSWLATVFSVWLFATAALSILWWFRVLPMHASGVLGMAWTTGLQV